MWAMQTDELGAPATIWIQVNRKLQQQAEEIQLKGDFISNIDIFFNKVGN